MNMMHWKVIVFWGGHIVLQRFVHVRCHFQPLPTKLVFAYFDRGSYVTQIIDDIHFAWQAQYLVRLEGDFTCSTHWK